MYKRLRSLKCFYSVFNIFAGLATAAFAEWNIAVTTAVITITRADNKNGATDRPALYGNMFNQLFI
ncbi:MAG TPA: hypothetical protein VII44_06775, partial [Puia sp.]